MKQTIGHLDSDCFYVSAERVRFPVGEPCEVGRKSEQKLAAHGITNCRQFIEAKSSFIQKLLTIEGESLWWELQDESVNKIVTSRPPHKAISRGGSLGGKTANGAQQHAWVVRNVERLIESLDYHGVFTRKPATHYYQVMTRNHREPVFTGEQI